MATKKNIKQYGALEGQRMILQPHVLPGSFRDAARGNLVYYLQHFLWSVDVEAESHKCCPRVESAFGFVASTLFWL